MLKFQSDFIPFDHNLYETFMSILFTIKQETVPTEKKLKFLLSITFIQLP